MKKRKYKLTDFLSKEVIDEFIQCKEDPEFKEAMDEAEEEISERLKDLYEFIGRELTRPERRRVIEIVEKYSPKDENDDFWSLETLLPFEHAWVIYEEELERKKELFMEKFKGALPND